MAAALLLKRGTAYVFHCLVFPWKGIALTIYESLMFAIAFATLIFHISNKNNKK